VSKDCRYSTTDLKQYEEIKASPVRATTEQLPGARRAADHRIR
jgi:hypothetical protein